MTLEDEDLRIYYSGNSYVQGRCHRFDIQDYNVICEVWLKKSDLVNLQNNIRPSAVKELKRVVYAPKFYDSSWSGKNTLKLKPVNSTGLSKMRGVEKVVYPSTISSSPLEGSSGWLNVKIESKISGSTL